MYEAWWNLNSRPFSSRCDADRYYLGRSHQAALVRLGYGLLNLNGPALLMGLSGVGKTALVRLFVAEHAGIDQCVQVLFPMLDPAELLAHIAVELNCPIAGSEIGMERILAAIREELRRQSSNSRRTLICFDDAHQLSDAAFEHAVQPLLTLAESDSDLLLSLLLIGQPLLSSRVRRCTPLAERVSLMTVISGFTPEDTTSWLKHCLEESGGRAEIFSPGAVQRLHDVTGGNPRRLNRLADMALVVGFADALPQITELQIDSISSELLPAAA
jgi:general secretion pathway protein A